MVFDTGPLLTFACSNSSAFNALGRLYGANAIWCAAVRDEITHKSRQSGWECLRQVLRVAWLSGRAVELNEPDDLADIEDVRQVFVRQYDGPRKHVGEAASIVLARRRGLPVVLDDQDAANYARTIEHLTVYRSLDLLLGILHASELPCPEGWTTYQRMTTVANLPGMSRAELCPSTCGKHR